MQTTIYASFIFFELQTNAPLELISFAVIYFLKMHINFRISIDLVEHQNTFSA